MTARVPNPFALLLLAVGLSYASAVHGGFVFDDGHSIANSPTIGDARVYLAGGGSRWLANLTVLVNHRLGGLNPLGYHLFNVGVHAAAVLVLFALLRRVLALPRFGGRFAASGEFLAFAAALVWAVHPLNTQAVAYVIQRAESLMGLFFLLTFYCWARAATDGPPRLWLPLAVLSFLACCHCKEVSVALPPLLWAFDRIFLADGWRAVVRSRWPAHVGILAVWGYSLRSVVGGAFGAEAVGIGFGIDTTPFQYLLTETEVLLHYLRLAVWPTGQVGDAVDWPVAKSVGEVAPALAAVVALFAGGVALLYLRPPVGFLFAWFFVVLGPTSSVMPIRDVMFEHRMYLPLIAVLVGLVFAADAALGEIRFRYPFGRPAVAVTLLAAAAVALGTLTTKRNAVYRNNAAFLSDCYAKRPDNRRAKAGVAEGYLAQGRYDEAQQMCDELRATNTTDLAFRLLLGELAHRNGRFDRTAEYYRQMAATDPWPFLPRYVYRRLIPAELAARQYAAAAASARTQVEKVPDSPIHRLTLAACELAVGNADAARTAAADAMARDPNLPAAFAADARRVLFARHPIPAAQAGLWEVEYWRVAAANLADGDRNPEWLDTQAQLAARLGRFSDAVTASQKGLAASAADPLWKAAHEDRLKLYRTGQVYGPKD